LREAQPEEQALGARLGSMRRDEAKTLTPHLTRGFVTFETR
jgi:hypothetical protein